MWEPFSKRQKRLAQAGKQEIYQYDHLPEAFRTQVFHIWMKAIGTYSVPQPAGYVSQIASFSTSNQFWQLIQNTVAEECGLPALGDLFDNPDKACIRHLLTGSSSQVIDLIEYSFRVIDFKIRRFKTHSEAAYVTMTADEAIARLNLRFKEHGIGYEYSNGMLMRIDSQFMQAEVVNPALSLLNSEGFDGPADEFLRAYTHHRNGLNKEAVNEALKAFESTMKSICAAKKWKYPATANAKDLIGILFANDLVPSSLQAHFSALRAVMESGLPTLRNKNSGHGQGPTPIELPDHFVGYALHLMAANIIFLVEAYKALK
jgi:hypothetical protein